MHTELSLDTVILNDCLVMQSASTSKQDVIEELTSLLVTADRVKDKDSFIRDVYDREAMGSTAFENGIAIPHGKSDAVTETSIAAAKLQHPVQWDADDEPVDLVFLFAVANEDKSDNHVRLLASVSMVLCEDDKVDALKTCQEASQFKSILSNS